MRIAIERSKETVSRNDSSAREAERSPPHDTPRATAPRAGDAQVAPAKRESGAPAAAKLERAFGADLFVDQVHADQAPSTSLEDSVRNLPRLSQGEALGVLKQLQRVIQTRIVSGEARIQQAMSLRAESFGNYLIGGAIEVFGLTSLPSGNWEKAWKPLNDAYGTIAKRQVKESLDLLLAATAATNEYWQQLNTYLEKTDKGADRSIFALQGLAAAGAVAAAALTGGGAAAIVAGAGYAGTQNLVGQVAAVSIGIQDKIDWAGLTFDTLFGALTGALGGRLGNAILKRLVGNKAVASVSRRILAEVTTDLISGRLSSLLQTTGRSVFDQLRGRKELTAEQFIESLAEQLMDPRAMFLDAILGRAAKITHAPAAKPAEPAAPATHAAAAEPPTKMPEPVPAAKPAEPATPAAHAAATEPPIKTPEPAPEAKPSAPAQEPPSPHPTGPKETAPGESPPKKAEEAAAEIGGKAAPQDLFKRYYELSETVAPYKDLRQRTAEHNAAVEEYDRTHGPKQPAAVDKLRQIGERLDAEHFIDKRFFEEFRDEFKAIGIHSTDEMPAFAVHTEYHLRSPERMSEIAGYAPDKSLHGTTLTQEKLTQIPHDNARKRYGSLEGVIKTFESFWKSKPGYWGRLEPEFKRLLQCLAEKKDYWSR